MKKIITKVFIISLTVISIAFMLISGNINMDVHAETAKEERDFNAITVFNPNYTMASPNFFFIYLTFDGELSDNVETMVSADDKKPGVTDMIYFNGKSLDKLWDLGANVFVRIRTSSDSLDNNTLELRYFADGEEPLNLTANETVITVKAGFNTEVATVKEEISVLYLGGVSPIDSWRLYRPKDIDTLKNEMNERINQIESGVSSDSFSTENWNILTLKIVDSKVTVSTNNTVFDIISSTLVNIKDINQFIRVNQYNPIVITSVEKAYQYPNKDISVTLMVDKAFANNKYKRVTLTSDELRSFIGQRGYFYTEEVIEQLELYNVRESLMNGISLNGYTLNQIYEMEGDDGINEPVRVDFEISNTVSNYYAFTLYVEGNSVFAKQYMPDLKSISTMEIKNTVKLMNFTINKDYKLSYNSENKVWMQTTKEALLEKIN